MLLQYKSTSFAPNYELMQGYDVVVMYFFIFFMK